MTFDASLGEITLTKDREIKMTIPIQPITKKNHQRIVVQGKRRMILPSEQYVQYEQQCGWFIKGKGMKIDKPCEVVCLFYMKDHRICDLPNHLASIDDILVKYGVLADDNSRILVSHDGSRVLYDPQNPRTEVTIRLL